MDGVILDEWMASHYLALAAKVGSKSGSSSDATGGGGGSSDAAAALSAWDIKPDAL